MAVFNPVDMSGPTHRGAQIQKLAQNAAQAVMRRQRMRSLIQAGAQRAGNGAGGVPTRGSMRARPPGFQGHNIPQFGGGNTLAAILAAQPASSPGRTEEGGQYATGGGGFDFASLPDPNDPRQSPQTTVPPGTVQPPPLPIDGIFGAAGNAANAAAGGGSSPNLPIGAIFGAANTATNAATGGNPNLPISAIMGAGANTIAAAGGLGGGQISGNPENDNGPTGQNLIPLGGGRFYDPSTDTIHGG